MSPADTQEVPIREKWPERRFTGTCNGIPVRRFANKAVAERYATDPEYRASLIVTKYADR